MLGSKGIDQRVQITMKGFVHNISLSKCSNIKEDSRFCPVEIRNSICWDFWQPTGTLCWCWLQRLHHLQPQHPDIYSEGSSILPVCLHTMGCFQKIFCMRNMWRHLFHDCNPELNSWNHFDNYYFLSCNTACYCWSANVLIDNSFRQRNNDARSRLHTLSISHFTGQPKSVMSSSRSFIIHMGYIKFTNAT